LPDRTGEIIKIREGSEIEIPRPVGEQFPQHFIKRRIPKWGLDAECDQFNFRITLSDEMAQVWTDDKRRPGGDVKLVSSHEFITAAINAVQFHDHHSRLIDRKLQREFGLGNNHEFTAEHFRQMDSGSLGPNLGIRDPQNRLALDLHAASFGCLVNRK